MSCSVKASTGQLYPLERSLAFIHKPTLIIKFEDISAVEFERFTGYGQSSATKNFDLKISTRGLSRRPFLISTLRGATPRRSRPRRWRGGGREAVKPSRDA